MSNSHAPSFSRRAAPARAWFCISICAPQKREARLCSRKRERSAVRRGGRERALRGTPTGLRTGLAVTALHCGVLNPWGPASLWPRRRGFAAPSGRGKERALGVIVRREAGPRTPGTTIANRGRRRRSPSTLGFALQSAPLWIGMNRTYENYRSASSISKNYFSDIPRGLALSRMMTTENRAAAHCAAFAVMSCACRVYPICVWRGTQFVGWAKRSEPTVLLCSAWARRFAPLPTLRSYLNIGPAT